MLSIKAICEQVSVIPVLVVEDVQHAIPLAETLVDAGLHVLEVTLRTPAALDVIAAMSKVPGAIVGAGTVLTPTQVKQCKEQGAEFIVSPGSTPQLLESAKQVDIPLLPGAATPSEVMSLMEKGYDVIKFFPAEMAGGVDYLKSLSSPFSGVQFCPTGGITEKTAPDYLKLPNVACIGGSWITPKSLLNNQDWSSVKKIALKARTLK